VNTLFPDSVCESGENTITQIPESRVDILGFTSMCTVLPNGLVCVCHDEYPGKTCFDNVPCVLVTRYMKLLTTVNYA